MTTRQRILTDVERLVYQNQYMRLFDNEVTFPNRVKGRYLKFDWTAPYSVGVLPILDDGRLYLVRNFRYPSDEMRVEIPKGFGSEGVPPTEMAARELREETGLSADSLRLVASVITESGIMNHSVHLFEAHGAKRVSEIAPEATEVLDVPLILELSESIDLIRRGEIVDSLTINAILLYKESAS